MATTRQERIEKLKEQQEKLSRRLKAEQSAASKDKRKLEAREKIQLGGLFFIAGLNGNDKGSLLGALLEMSKTIKDNPQKIKEWKAKGDALLAGREAERKAAKK
jgi:acetyl-CoA carboxylase carboxyltransferase component